MSLVIKSEDKEFVRPRLPLTKNIPKPNEYILALDNEYKDFAFNEERALANKGQWHHLFLQNIKNYKAGLNFNQAKISEQKFSDSTCLDVEIGTGNGKHFFYHSQKFPNRFLVGLELKYKPLIQSIRRIIKVGDLNAMICRFHAMNIDQLFSENEINNVYIHFPDPWVTPRKPRNRFVNRRVLSMLHQQQKADSFIEFKTDSREYFDWALDEIAMTPYKIEKLSFDLHKDQDLSEKNFKTEFENIFIKQKIPINYVLLRR
jgi:tRNA (guanine-N7-)-methyltransferase